MDVAFIAEVIQAGNTFLIEVGRAILVHIKEYRKELYKWLIPMAVVWALGRLFLQLSLQY